MRSILDYFKQPEGGAERQGQHASPSTNTNTNVPHTSTPVIAFTDGSFKNNVAGCAVVFPDYQNHNYSERLTDRTNNRAEYIALIKAIEITTESIDPAKGRDLIVNTDSELLVNTINKWMPGWKRRGWIKADGKPVKNLDLVKKIDELLKTRRVLVRHVRAHTKRQDYSSRWNDAADKLAKRASSGR